MNKRASQNEGQNARRKGRRQQRGKPQHIYRERERDKNRRNRQGANKGARPNVYTEERQHTGCKIQPRKKNPGERRREGDTEGQGGEGIQRGEAAGAETAQDRQARTLQTSYEPSRPLLDRSLKEAIEGEVLSF